MSTLDPTEAGRDTLGSATTTVDGPIPPATEQSPTVDLPASETTRPADDDLGHLEATGGQAPSPGSIPGYELLELVGGGGMGEVWKARQLGLNRIVALKRVLRGYEAGPKELIRFLAEAEAVASIKHPHVVQVHEFGDADGHPYLVMEFLPGGSLSDRLQQAKRLDPKPAANLVATLADAVQAAHDQGIVHRDLKPANVLFDGAGQPKVTDFGLAKRAGASDLTETDAVLGTPAYMAPEQARGNTKFVGPETDVYSLGVILYQALTGHRPFHDLDRIALLRKVAEAEPTRPRKHVPDLPRDVELICLKCLEKEPAERYSTAGALADDLRRFVAGESVSVRAAGTVERLAKWARRQPTLAAVYALATLALLLATLGGLAIWEWHAAEVARDVAVEAQKGEAKARAEAEAEREKFEHFEYGRTMQVAHQEWRENNVVTSVALIEGTRDDLRGWEWRYLHRLCHLEQLALKGRTAVLSAAFSPDGSRIVTACADRTAQVWDARAGAALLTLKGHSKVVHSAGFSPDGSRVVTASEDGTARVWDARTGVELLTLKGHTGVVYSAAFSPDGSRVVTASYDRTARVWDARTGAETFALKGHAGAIHSAGFSPDGSRIITTSVDQTARVWDARAGVEDLSLKEHLSYVTSAAFSPDGSRVVTASYDQTARVWDARAGAALLTLKGHSKVVHSAGFSPDGSRVATASEDGTARVWDARTGVELLTLKGHTGVVYSAGFSPDGSRIVTASYDRTARVWDARTAAELLAMRGHDGVVYSAGFSPDGSRVVTASYDRTARVWDACTGAKLLTLRGPLFISAAFSPDGSRIVTVGAEGTARVWDARAGVELLAFKGHAGRVASVAFSPDGSRVVTASYDRTARVWDARAGAELLTLKGHAGVVASAGFSPDGSRVVTASWDGTARIWDSTPVSREFLPKDQPAPPNAPK